MQSQVRLSGASAKFPIENGVLRANALQLDLQKSAKTRRNSAHTVAPHRGTAAQMDAAYQDLEDRFRNPITRLWWSLQHPVRLAVRLFRDTRTWRARRF